MSASDDEKELIIIFQKEVMLMMEVIWLLEMN